MMYRNKHKLAAMNQERNYGGRYAGYGEISRLEKPHGKNLWRKVVVSIVSLVLCGANTVAYSQ